MLKEIVPASALDCALLAPFLRQEDAAECWAACGHKPLAALQASFDQSSICYTGMNEDGDPIFMFGVVPVPSLQMGAIWMLCADLSVRESCDIIGLAPVYIECFHQHGFTKLGNVVDARNKLHIKWLRKMGFEFTKVHQQFGFLKLPFHEFFKEVSHLRRVGFSCDNPDPRDGLTGRSVPRPTATGKAAV